MMHFLSVGAGLYLEVVLFVLALCFFVWFYCVIAEAIGACKRTITCDCGRKTATTTLIHPDQVARLEQRLTDECPECRRESQVKSPRSNVKTRRPSTLDFEPSTH